MPRLDIRGYKTVQRLSPNYINWISRDVQPDRQGHPPRGRFLEIRHRWPCTSIHVNVLIRRNHEMLAVDTTLLHLEPESGLEA